VRHQTEVILHSIPETGHEWSHPIDFLLFSDFPPIRASASAADINDIGLLR